MGSFLSPLLRDGSDARALVNETRAATLASQVEIAVDSRARRRGLLGRDGLERGAALAIAPCGGIHTCFMRFPIDVIFAGRDGRVRRLYTEVLPWRIAMSPFSFAALELPAGTIVRTGTRVGDRLAIAAKGKTDFSLAENRI